MSSRLLPQKGLWHETIQRCHLNADTHFNKLNFKKLCIQGSYTLMRLKVSSLKNTSPCPKRYPFFGEAIAQEQISSEKLF